MKDSNYTLRFNRSAREAYGHDIQFSERHRGDIFVLCIAFFIFGFIAGALFV